MILTHSIIIILGRIDTLKGNATDGSLQALRERAVYTDEWLQENHENELIPLSQREAAHSWMHSVQDKLTETQGAVGDLVNECPV